MAEFIITQHRKLMADCQSDVERDMIIVVILGYSLLGILALLFLCLLIVLVVPVKGFSRIECQDGRGLCAFRSCAGESRIERI